MGVLSEESQTCIPCPAPSGEVGLRHRSDTQNSDRDQRTTAGESTGPEDNVQETATRNGEVEYFRLRVNEAVLAVEAALVQEVVRVPLITPLPNVPRFLVGVAAHRGEVLAVIDLAQVLGSGQTVLGGRSRMALIQCRDLTVALLADEMLGLISWPKDALKTYENRDQRADFLAGEVLHQGQTAYVLDLERALIVARRQATNKK